MSENKGFPGSVRTGGFGLTLQSVCCSRKKCCQRWVLQPVPPSASLMSFLTPLAVFWVWHPYLPLNGSHCVLAICGIDQPAPISHQASLPQCAVCPSPSPRPQCHVSMKLSPSQCPPWTPPLQSRQQAAYYGGIKRNLWFHNGCQVLALPLTSRDMACY